MKTIVGNWKMNGDVASAQALAEAICKHKAPDATVVICPPAPLLAQVQAAIKGSNILLGAQDCSCETNGAYTGDVSAVMLKSLGCSYIILGHSERRDHHRETSEQVRKKAEAVMKAGLIPIICVGETCAEREAGRAEEIVSKQVKASIPANQQSTTNSHFLLAYEPVWAIGSGKTPSASDIGRMHAHIASITGNKNVLYGGSVHAANAREILGIPGVAGVLVGGASLKAEEFCGIIKAA